MFKRFSVPLAFITLGATQAASAASSYDQGQWVTTFTAGTSLIPFGTFQQSATGNIPDLGTLNPIHTGESGAVELGRISFADAFRVGPGFGIETGYLTNSNVEPFVRLDYSQLQGRNARLGSVTTPALESPAAITGNFDDMESWTLNVGARYFLTDLGPIRPFFAGYVGVDRTDAMYTHLGVSGVKPESGKEELLPRETRMDAGVETGLNYQFTDQATLQFSVGANYAVPRHEETAAFESLGVEPIRVAEQRWSIPVDVGLSFKF